MKKKTVLCCTAAVLAAFAIGSVVRIHFNNDVDGVGARGEITYKGRQMILGQSGLHDLPDGFELSSETVEIGNNALLISGEYEVYSSKATDDTIYIYVDDENVSQSKCGYWEFVCD